MAELNDFESMLSNTLSGGQDLLNGSWSAKNKVNKPNLANTGLTPVTINSNGTYGIPDIEADSWYSYDGTTNRWANAQTKDGSTWVWIPRYAYKLDENAKTIDVVFLQGTTNKDYNGNDVTLETYVNTDNETGAYIVHPAFKNGTQAGFANGEWDKEIAGFWMAKFEAGYVGEAGNPNSAIDSGVTYSTIYSYDGANYADYAYNYYYNGTSGTRAVGTAIKYPTFQANRASVNFIGISDAYDLCREIQDATTVYGLKNTDSHMTKNSEWGAVAYLAYSKYGRNEKEVVLNNISLNNSTESLRAVTGYGATATNAGTKTATLAEIQAGSVAGSWLTAQGQTASTTGNIYGIYDMSGGEWEWTSSYIATGTNYNDYAGSLAGDSTKYRTKYAYSESNAGSPGENYKVQENLDRIGDAIAETSTNGADSASGWFNDYSYFPDSGTPFFIHGGRWIVGSDAGTFSFSRGNGYCYSHIGFRAVLVVE